MLHRPAVSLLALAACGGGNPGLTDARPDAPPPECASWRQWGNSATHAGASCVVGQPLQKQLADVVYDPYLTQEVIDARGDLLVHYQTPLIDGDDLFMMTKKGTYTACNVGVDGPSCDDPDELYRLSSQVWAEQRFAIATDGSLALQWSYDSDWKPEPQTRFEPMFQPALAGTLIAIPGAGGALWELDAQSGQVVRHVQPFGATTDPDTYVAGGIAVGPDGTIYYNALKLDHAQPLAMPAQGWLVAVATDGTTRKVDYAALATGAPHPTDLCVGTYELNVTQLPWPPTNPDGSLIMPPTSACGAQRPGVNTAPAIGPDGTIFVVSRAHFNTRYSYVIAVGANLAPRWATSLRDFLHDGCGVTSVSDGTDTVANNHCKVGTPVGVERVTGLAPAPTVDDDSSSSPVALPDGGVLYGAFSDYNGSRGHLMKLDHAGKLVGNYDFGWDSTPAVFGDANNYKIVVKDNHYGFGPFFITELDASMNQVWKFTSTNTRTCSHQPDGSVACTDDHPYGFEWCINAPAVDRDGTVYVTSEDGNAYAIDAAGRQRDSFFLDRAIGAAYTPTALDHTGRMFALNAGHLSVLGR